MSSFINEHPGGAHLLTKSVGKDATTAFFGGVYDHSNAAHNVCPQRWKYHLFVNRVSFFIATCNEKSGGTARRHAPWAAGPNHTAQPKADDRPLRRHQLLIVFVVIVYQQHGVLGQRWKPRPRSIIKKLIFTVPRSVSRHSHDRWIESTYFLLSWSMAHMHSRGKYSLHPGSSFVYTHLLWLLGG